MSASDPGDGGRPGTALYLLRHCDDAVRQAWSQPLDALVGCFVEVTVVPNDAVPEGLVVDVDPTDGGPWPPADDGPDGAQSANWEW